MGIAAASTNKVAAGTRGECQVEAGGVSEVAAAVVEARVVCGWGAVGVGEVGALEQVDAVVAGVLARGVEAGVSAMFVVDAVVAEYGGWKALLP